MPALDDEDDVAALAAVAAVGAATRNVGLAAEAAGAVAAGATGHEDARAISEAGHQERSIRRERRRRVYPNARRGATDSAAGCR